MNDDVQKLLKDRYYLDENENTWEDFSDRIDGIYNLNRLMHEKKFIPSTPTLINANTNGKRIGTLSSCFPLSVSDSIEEIGQSWKECAIVTKYCGGVGYNFSKLRSSVEGIKGLNGRLSSGALPFIKTFNTILDGVSQGGSRRGAGMWQSHVFHPDIWDHICAKRNKISTDYNRFNFTVRMPNSFYNTLAESPDSIHKVYLRTTNKWVDALDDKGNVYTVKKLWDLIIDTAHRYAESGLFNETTAWDNFTVKDGHSVEDININPCLLDSTLLLTKDGLRSLKDVPVGDSIWSKEGWTTIVNKFPTGNKEVFEYSTSFGTLEATENHEVEQKGIKVSLADAESIDVLKGFTPQDGLTTVPEYIMDGLVLGDGTVHKASNNLVYLNIGENDKDYFSSEVKHLIIKDRTKAFKYGWEINTNITAEDLRLMYLRRIPSRYMELDRSETCSFLKGLFSANGSICGDRITYKTNNIDMVRDLQVLLSSVGIRSYYTTNKPCTVSHINGDYTSKQSYDLNITRDRLTFFMNIGFLQMYKMDRLESIVKSKKNATPTTVISSKITNKKSLGNHDVWDITVDNDSHTFWNKGFSISNCAEFVHLDNTSCALGSINLSKFFNEETGKIDWNGYEKAIRKGLRFLNKTFEVNNYPLDKIKETTLKHRAVGLGTMGLAHLLYKLRLPFNSEEGLEMVRRIYKFLALVSYDESNITAKERGHSYDSYNEKDFLNARITKQILDKKKHVFGDIEIDTNDIISNIKKYGMANSKLNAIAPTGSISFMAETSSGIEPVFALSFMRKIEVGRNEDDTIKYEKVFITDKVFQSFLEANYPDRKDEILEEVTDNKGSCQKSKILSKEDKAIFVTAQDMSSMDHLDSLAEVVKSIDMSCSKTINLPKHASKKDVAEVYVKAHKLGVLGVTVYRDGSRDGILHTSDEEPIQDSIISLKDLDKAKKNAVKEDEEEIINKDLKLPSTSLSETFTLKSEGSKFYVTVTYFEETFKPFAVFINTNSKIKHAEIKNVVNDIFDLALSKGISDKIIKDQKDKIKDCHNIDKFARALSMALRHGISISNIASTIDNAETGLGLVFRVSKFLKTFLEGHKVIGSPVCEKCGEKGTVVHEGGCRICKSCGDDKCGA